MNLKKVFNFIKEKRGYDYPFMYKLINRLPLSEDELNVSGNLDLNNTKITSLPDNFYVSGSVYLNSSNITSLPNNLKVGDSLYLSNTKITSLPNNLKVGGYLILNNTPISEKYTEEEIKKMIEDKGGFVKETNFLVFMI
jgi:hypothetical protein